MPVQLLHEIVAAPPLDPCRRRQLEPVPPTSSLIGDVLVAFDQITSRAWRASGDRFFACFLIAAPTSRRRRNPAWSARRRVEDAGRQRRAPPLMGYLFIPPTFVFLPHPARFPSQVNEGSLPTVKKMPCGCGSNCSCGSGCGCETEKKAAAAAPTVVLGVAPEKRSLAVSSAREGCRCGSNCSCNPCNC